MGGGEKASLRLQFNRHHHSWGTRSKLRLVPFFVCASLVLTLFLSACGGESFSELSDQSGNLTSADEVLTASREALRSVISYRSEKHMVGKTQPERRNIATSIFKLIWSAPDSINLRVEGTQEGEEEQGFEIIAVDGRVFARQSTTGNIWAEYETDPNPDDREARGMLSTARRFSAAPDFVPTMDEAELLGKEFIDGLSVYHIRGTRSVKQELPDDFPADVTDNAPLQHDDSTYHLYVSTSDFLPRRLLTETNIRWETSLGETSEMEPVNIYWTENFLDYNGPVTIELPEVP